MFNLTRSDALLVFLCGFASLAAVTLVTKFCNTVGTLSITAPDCTAALAAINLVAMKANIIAFALTQGTVLAPSDVTVGKSCSSVGAQRRLYHGDRSHGRALAVVDVDVTSSIVSNPTSIAKVRLPEGCTFVNQCMPSATMTPQAACRDNLDVQV